MAASGTSCGFRRNWWERLAETARGFLNQERRHSVDYDTTSMRGLLGGVAGGVPVATLSSSPAAAILIGSLAGVLGTVLSDVVRAAGRFLVSWFRARTAH